MLLDLETYWTIPNCQPWWRNQALKDAFWVPIYFPQKQVDPTDPATSERHHNEIDTRKRWAARRFDIPRWSKNFAGQDTHLWSGRKWEKYPLANQHNYEKSPQEMVKGGYWDIPAFIVGCYVFFPVDMLMFNVSSLPSMLFFFCDGDFGAILPRTFTVDVWFEWGR